MAVRPLAVVFDVNETLFSLDAIGHRLDAVGAPPATLERWFGTVLSSGFAITAADGFVSFRDLAQSILTRMLDDSARAKGVLDAFTELEPHPDVRPALERLAGAGIPAFTLTNGHAETTEALLERAGLRHLVAACYDATGAGRWKPASRAYSWCSEQIRVPPYRLGLVAVHSWDIHGARRTGFVTGYSPRLEGAPVAHFDRADVEASDLVAVIDGFLALDEG